jgi:tRNA(adenine34) deaminase
MKSRKRASAVCVYGGELLCVRLRDPLSRVARLFVPGGQLEPGESPAQAAVRETVEETGYRISVDRTSELVARYPFVWNGHTVACETHFFRATLQSNRNSPDPVDDANYHEGALWLPLQHLAQLDFDPTIYEAIQALIYPTVAK